MKILAYETKLLDNATKPYASAPTVFVTYCVRPKFIRMLRMMANKLKKIDKNSLVFNFIKVTTIHT